jgi:glutamate racemase
MNSTSRPIAVFDSGVGGISVLRELVKLMPREQYLYFGDSANAPYGDKSTEQVRQLTLDAARMLLQKGAKALVVACNTATAAAIDVLRETYPDKIIIGIEPALKMGADRFPEGRIGVMATQVTLREEKFLHQTERFPMVHVQQIPAPGLVELIESGRCDSQETRVFLEKLLLPYKGQLDALVLGCTHYPFVRSLVSEILGAKTQILDGGEGTARQTMRCLEAAGLLSDGPGGVEMVNSSNDPRLIALCHQLLEQGGL